jgi:hypothetical protein
MSVFGDAPGGSDRPSLEISTWRQWSCELGGRDRASMKLCTLRP